ncbi:hypothetical protein ACFVXC_35085 [Streptomyces sp. NPDC058257]|uniref:hypothetical protein n=1 Tax=unclassified Streptomyces TaxID=2593676 RepID=UPI00365345C2
MDYTYEFHETVYEPTMYGPKDNSTRIALDFASNSRETSRILSEASRKLAEAVRDLTLAIGEGQSFKTIGDHQEEYQTALREFEGLHRKWVTQATTARMVFHDYWTDDQSQD